MYNNDSTHLNWPQKAIKIICECSKLITTKNIKEEKINCFAFMLIKFFVSYLDSYIDRMKQYWLNNIKKKANKRSYAIRVRRNLRRIAGIIFKITNSTDSLSEIFDEEDIKRAKKILDRVEEISQYFEIFIINQAQFLN